MENGTGAEGEPRDGGATLGTQWREATRGENGRDGRRRAGCGKRGGTPAMGGRSEPGYRGSL